MSDDEAVPLSEKVARLERKIVRARSRGEAERVAALVSKLSRRRAQLLADKRAERGNDGFDEDNDPTMPPAVPAVGKGGKGGKGKRARDDSKSHDLWTLQQDASDAAAAMPTPAAPAGAGAKKAAKAVTGALAPAPAPALAPALSALNSSFEHKWTEHVGEGAGAFTSGKWTKSEDTALQAAIDDFCLERGLDAAAITNLATAPVRASAAAGIWTAVAAGFSTRTIRSVMRRGIRLLHPGNHRGAWSDAEKELLQQLVAKYGRKWKAIGAELNRMPSTCEIVFSRLPGGGGSPPDPLAAKAPPLAPGGSWDWSEPEEKALLAAVTKQCNKAGTTVGSFTGPWAIVAAAVGTRTASQCTDKWGAYGARLQGLAWTHDRDAALVDAVVNAAAAARATRATLAWATLLPHVPGAAARARFDVLIRNALLEGLSLSAGATALLARFKVDGGGE